jgi:anti-anti-sigma factor
LIDQGVLNIVVVQGGNAVEIRAVGEADLASVHVLEQAIHDAFAGGASTVVVECAQLSYLDSSGVRCLLNAEAEAEAHGARVVVRNPSPIVRRVLEITKVDHLLCEDPRHAEPFGAS